MSRDVSSSSSTEIRKMASKIQKLCLTQLPTDLARDNQSSKTREASLVSQGSFGFPKILKVCSEKEKSDQGLESPSRRKRTRRHPGKLTGPAMRSLSSQSAALRDQTAQNRQFINIDQNPQKQDFSRLIGLKDFKGPSWDQQGHIRGSSSPPTTPSDPKNKKSLNSTNNSSDHAEDLILEILPKMQASDQGSDWSLAENGSVYQNQAEIEKWHDLATPQPPRRRKLLNIIQGSPGKELSHLESSRVSQIFVEDESMSISKKRYLSPETQQKVPNQSMDDNSATIDSTIEAQSVIFDEIEMMSHKKFFEVKKPKNAKFDNSEQFKGKEITLEPTLADSKEKETVNMSGGGENSGLEAFRRKQAFLSAIRSFEAVSKTDKNTQRSSLPANQPGFQKPTLGGLLKGIKLKINSKQKSKKKEEGRGDWTTRHPLGVKMSKNSCVDKDRVSERPRIASLDKKGEIEAFGLKSRNRNRISNQGLKRALLRQARAPKNDGGLQKIMDKYSLQKSKKIGFKAKEGSNKKFSGLRHCREAQSHKLSKKMGLLGSKNSQIENSKNRVLSPDILSRQFQESIGDLDAARVNNETKLMLERASIAPKSAKNELDMKLSLKAPASVLTQKKSILKDILAPKTSFVDRKPSHRFSLEEKDRFSLLEKMENFGRNELPSRFNHEKRAHRGSMMSQEYQKPALGQGISIFSKTEKFENLAKNYQLSDRFWKNKHKPLSIETQQAFFSPLNLQEPQKQQNYHFAQNLRKTAPNFFSFTTGNPSGYKPNPRSNLNNLSHQNNLTERHRPNLTQKPILSKRSPSHEASLHRVGLTGVVETLPVQRIEGFSSGLSKRGRDKERLTRPSQSHTSPQICFEKLKGIGERGGRYGEPQFNHMERKLGVKQF